MIVILGWNCSWRTAGAGTCLHGDSMLLCKEIKAGRHCWALWLKTSTKFFQRSRNTLGREDGSREMREQFSLNCVKLRGFNETVIHWFVILLSQIGSVTTKGLFTGSDLAIHLHLKWHWVLCLCQNRSEYIAECVSVLPDSGSAHGLECSHEMHVRSTQGCCNLVWVCYDNSHKLPGYECMGHSFFFFARQVCVFNPCGLGEEVERVLSTHSTYVFIS